jgi:hypothetical protein
MLGASVPGERSLSIIKLLYYLHVTSQLCKGVKVKLKSLRLKNNLKVVWEKVAFNCTFFILDDYLPSYYNNIISSL